MARAACAGAAVVLVAAGLAVAAPAGDAPRRGVQAPALALHFDFFAVEGATIADAAGGHHDGTLAGGTVVFGRRKNAAQLDGAGAITLPDTPPALDPAGRGFTVGALCRPDAPDGVLVSMGDAADGFALAVRGGVPVFSVRSGGALKEVAAVEAVPVGQWVHLAGALAEDGTASILVNTWSDAQAKAAPLAATPREPLAVGADPGAAVAAEGSPPAWRGLVEDVRLYWGVLDRVRDADTFKDWANMPGCGCSG